MERRDSLIASRDAFVRLLESEEKQLKRFISHSEHERFNEWPKEVQNKHFECIATLKESLPKRKADIAALNAEIQALDEGQSV